MQTPRRPQWLDALLFKLGQNHLWQRTVKHTIAVTIAFAIVVVPALSDSFGGTAFLAPMATVFAHSGRRLGEMIESLGLILAGAIVGTAWSILGLYLHSLLFVGHPVAAYAIKAVFVLLMVLFHGWLRSQSPRIFTLLWIALLTSFTALLGAPHFVSTATVTEIFYPLLIALGVLLGVGLLVFPEFSSDFLGSVIIETLHETEIALDDAIGWFIEPREHAQPPRSPPARNSGKDYVEKKGDAAQLAPPSRVRRLARLTGAKGLLRAKLGHCKTAYAECSYEITYAALPFRNLKPISNSMMSGLVRNVIVLISACESKFALEGDGEERQAPEEAEAEVTSDASEFPSDGEGDSGNSEVKAAAESSQDRRVAPWPNELPWKRASSGYQTPLEKIDLVKPRREIATGNAELLELLLAHVRTPIAELHRHVKAAIDLVIISLAFCYEVQRSPTGSAAPKGILLEEIDVRVDSFEEAISLFDQSSLKALGRAALMEEEETGQLDIMPRTETFLISSVLLSFRQAAVITLQMLKHSRKVVERRQRRNGRKKLWVPRRIHWRSWLTSTGERDFMSLPQNARQEARTGQDLQPPATRDADSDDEDSSGGMVLLPLRNDEEARPEESGKPNSKAATATGQSSAQPQHTTKPKKEKKKRRPGLTPGSLAWVRENAADVVEGVAYSEHSAYALKLAVAVFLVSFPAFVPSMTGWYGTSRASWAPLQLVLVFEVAIGSSLWVMFVRAFGVIFGCVWGYVAYEVSFGHRPALVVLMMIGIVPSAYVQLGTPYVKAGMISIVSMTVVALGESSSRFLASTLRRGASTDGNSDDGRTIRAVGDLPEAHGSFYGGRSRCYFRPDDSLSREGSGPPGGVAVHLRGAHLAHGSLGGRGCRRCHKHDLGPLEEVKCAVQPGNGKGPGRAWSGGNLFALLSERAAS